MDRTSGDNYAVVDGKRMFTDGPPATTVTDDWLNTVQEEICAVIEGVGTTLDPNNRGQLKTAIAAMISTIAAATGGGYVSLIKFSTPGSATSYTWSVPSGVTTVMIECWGGGGGGGGASGANFVQGTAGTSTLILNSALAAIFNIGAGSPATNSTNPGGGGSVSTFPTRGWGIVGQPGECSNGVSRGGNGGSAGRGGGAGVDGYSFFSANKHGKHPAGGGAGIYGTGGGMAGGGAGGYACAYLSVIPGERYYLTVGSGGAGGQFSLTGSQGGNGADGMIIIHLPQ